jgi:hypothetical protein
MVIASIEGRRAGCILDCGRTPRPAPAGLFRRCGTAAGRIAETDSKHTISDRWVATPAPSEMDPLSGTAAGRIDQPLLQLWACRAVRWQTNPVLRSYLAAGRIDQPLPTYIDQPLPTYIGTDTAADTARRRDASRMSPPLTPPMQRWLRACH